MADVGGGFSLGTKKTWMIVISIVFLLGVGGFLVYWFAFRSESTPTPTTSDGSETQSAAQLAAQGGAGTQTVQFTSSTLSSSNRTKSRGGKSRLDETAACSLVTSDQQRQFYVREGSYVCTEEQTDYGDDFRFLGADPEAGVHLYEPWTGLKVNINSINAEYYSVYLSFEDDYFVDGFNPGPDGQELTDEQIQAQIEALGTGLANAVYLIGSSETMSCDDGRESEIPVLTFDTNESNQTANMRETFSNMDNLQVYNKKGVLRVAAKWMQYNFTLNGEPHAVRVYLADCNGKMGEKSWQFPDGTFRFYNLDTQEWSETRPNNPITFWNFGGDEGEEPDIPDDVPEEEKAAIEAEIAAQQAEQAAQEAQEVVRQEAFQEMYRAFASGIVIELQNEAPDWTLLEQENANLKIDFKIDGRVGFGEGYTEAELVASPEIALQAFEIPTGLSLRAIVSIETK